MIAVDTNILIYAHRAESPFHSAALAVVKELAEGSQAWAVPWPCLHEFLAITTHPRVFKPPTPAKLAFEQVAAWLASPALVLLAESDRHWDVLHDLLYRGAVAGPVVHDAKIAALCMQHDVRELWTADRDFSRFPPLRTRNPLVRRAESAGRTRSRRE